MAEYCYEKYRMGVLDHFYWSIDTDYPAQWIFRIKATNSVYRRIIWPELRRHLDASGLSVTPYYYARDRETGTWGAPISLIDVIRSTGIIYIYLRVWVPLRGQEGG
jgi:hypothetical protein